MTEDQMTACWEDTAKAEQLIATFQQNAVADKIRSALCEDIEIDQRVLSTEASIGVAIYPEDGADAEALLKYADGGMYREKIGQAPAPRQSPL